MTLAAPILRAWRVVASTFRSRSATNFQPLDPPQADTFSTTRASPWTPSHRHKKGGLYRVLGHGVLEADGCPMTIYDDAEGTVWIRPVSEFEDGRFQRYEAPRE